MSCKCVLKILAQIHNFHSLQLIRQILPFCFLLISYNINRILGEVQEPLLENMILQSERNCSDLENTATNGKVIEVRTQSIFKEYIFQEVIFGAIHAGQQNYRRSNMLSLLNNIHKSAYIFNILFCFILIWMSLHHS